MSRNGIDLLNPLVEPDNFGFSQTDVDFCIFVINAEYSQEATFKINEEIYQADELDNVWSPDCDAFSLAESSENKLRILELSFPIDVLEIPNGIMQSEPKVAQGDLDRGGSLIIRYVDANNGEFLEELSVYSH